MSDEKNTCFLFHKWSKWKTYVETGVVFSMIVKKSVDYTETRQKRTCERCGFTQDLPVKNS